MRNAARHERVVIYSRSIISSPKTKNGRAHPIRRLLFLLAARPFGSFDYRDRSWPCQDSIASDYLGEVTSFAEDWSGDSFASCGAGPPTLKARGLGPQDWAVLGFPLKLPKASD